jgi:Cytochrome P460
MRNAKLCAFLALVAAMVASVIVCMAFEAGPADEKCSPIFGVTIPPGYREWQLIAPSQETGSLDELRSILGNGVAMNAYRKGALPFPDGSILVKLGFGVNECWYAFKVLVLGIKVRNG